MMKPGEMELVEQMGGRAALPAKEKKRLSELEGVIAKNFRAFYEVGCALREIRDNHYYREDYLTFENYCRDLWDMCRSYAHRLIDASGVVENLITWNQTGENVAHGQHGNQASSESSDTGVNNCSHLSCNLTIPENERQARILAKLAPEDQPRVWQRVVETIPEDGRITAPHIRKTIRDMNLETISEIVSKAKEEDLRIKDDRVSEDFSNVFYAFLDQVRTERKDNWRYTKKEVVLRYLESLHTAVRSEV